jgi:hypothetical protein
MPGFFQFKPLCSVPLFGPVIDQRPMAEGGEGPLTPSPVPSRRRAAAGEDVIFDQPKRRRLPQDETDQIDVFYEVQIFKNGNEELIRSEIGKVSHLPLKLRFQVVIHTILQDPSRFLEMKSFKLIK